MVSRHPVRPSNWALQPRELAWIDGRNLGLLLGRIGLRFHVDGQLAVRAPGRCVLDFQLLGAAGQLVLYQRARRASRLLTRLHLLDVFNWIRSG